MTQVSFINDSIRMFEENIRMFTRQYWISVVLENIALIIAGVVTLCLISVNEPVPALFIVCGAIIPVYIFEGFRSASSQMIEHANESIDHHKNMLLAYAVQIDNLRAERKDNS